MVSHARAGSPITLGIRPCQPRVLWALLAQEFSVPFLTHAREALPDSQGNWPRAALGSSPRGNPGALHSSYPTGILAGALADPHPPAVISSPSPSACACLSLPLLLRGFSWPRVMGTSQQRVLGTWMRVQKQRLCHCPTGHSGPLFFPFTIMGRVWGVCVCGQSQA